MNPYRISLFVVILGALVGQPLVTGSATSSSTYVLAPQTIADEVCCSSGVVSPMWALDQTRRQDTPGNYALFTTPGHRYKGYRSYLLPSTIQRSTVSSLQVKVNYKGPAASIQTWSWSAWNWNRSRWIQIGTNALATAGIWKVMKFPVSNPRAYINSATGEIRIRLVSNNGTGNAKLDYEAVLVSSTDIVGCSLYPPDNVWNTPIDTLPVNIARSSAWINSIGAGTGFHMDFGSGTWDGGPIGIPYNIVDGTQLKKYTVSFYYPDESDPGPYPLPGNPAREWGSDHHILVVDASTCTLYELYDASFSNSQWHAGSGAIWNLNSNALRPDGWTSADAAGLPILPGLARYQEVANALMQASPAAQVIHHALRFTAGSTNSYIWPARHLTSGSPGTLTNTPPMGARFRLKSTYDISGFTPELQVILRTMQTYGIILADNGSSWYVSGSPDSRWNNDMLHDLDVLKGSDFEAVDESCLQVSADSGRADLSLCP